ncbi:MAG: transglycosylase domain-containing protein [Bacteroidia bacterium]
MAPEKEKSLNPYRRYIRIFWIVLFLPPLTLVIMVGSIALFADLPATKDLTNPKTNLASEVFSADLKTMGKYYKENRVNVKYKELDTTLVAALVATEDSRFYDHSGVDGKGLFRVLSRTIIGGDRSSGGGSTLSQQLAKMLFPRETHQSKWQMIKRKIKEWIIAVRLERQYTKEEILTMYLNKFDFLNQAVGIKSAAQIYFDTTPDKLQVEQSAMLVGMAKNPAIFNPASARKVDTTMQRRNVVMKQMVKYHFLSQVRYDSLKIKPIKLHFRPEDHNEGLATYFREYLRDRFLKKWCSEHLNPATGKNYDMYRDGLRIFTTIDSRMQKYAEEAVAHHMQYLQGEFDKLKKKNWPFSWKVTRDEIENIMHSAMKASDRYRNMKEAGASESEIETAFHTPTEMRVFHWSGDRDTTLSPWDSIRYYKSFLQTGFMSMEPQTGFVKAWVGGINYRHFKYDHVKESKRQVGSTFKPFVYALAIQEGWSPCMQVPCVHTCIDLPEGGQWCPDNAGGHADDILEGKMITLKKALALSINYVSAYIMKQFGPKAVEQFARRCGITSPIEIVPSMCLGTPDLSVYEMVGANSTFANKGTWMEPIFVTRIEDKSGKVIAEFMPKSEEAMNEEKAYIMTILMKGVVDYGTGASLRGRYKLTNPIAGKTGTTQNNSDGWFMGLTPDLVSGCWVGGEDRSVHFDNMALGQGATMALPIWGLYMQKVYADKTLKVSQRDFDKPAKKISIELDCSKFDKDGGDIPPEEDPFVEK